MFSQGLTCVVVLYKKLPADSTALQDLRRAVRTLDHASRRVVSIVIYDNSPSSAPWSKDQWSEMDVTYLHDASNSGLAVGYATAMRYAQAAHHQWLLLLDQDTEIGTAFLPALLETLEEHIPETVGALVPRLVHEGATLSPTRVHRMREYPIESGFQGICDQRIAAMNSAACLRVSALEGIGGFPAEYPLDFLDHAVFFRLQKAHWKIMVLNHTLEHHLSLLHLKQEMPIARYKTLLRAEQRFSHESLDHSGRWILRLRLLKRGWKQLTQQRSSAHAVATFKSAFLG